MTKYFNKFKKPCLWPISGPFFQILGQNFFSSENQAMSRITSYGLLASCQNAEKTNNTIPRKCLDRRTDGKTEGQNDGQTLFHSNPPATAGGPIFQNKIKISPTVLLQVLQSIYKLQPSIWVLKKGVLKICSKFTRQHPCQSLISLKLQSRFGMGVFL